MIEWETSKTGHPDLYIPFFEIGYKLLNEGGILGYITVNSFIKSVNGRAIRRFFQENQVDLKIIDFRVKNNDSLYTDYSYATSYTNLATIATELNQYEEAKKYFDLAFKYSKKDHCFIEKPEDDLYEKLCFYDSSM